MDRLHFAHGQTTAKLIEIYFDFGNWFAPRCVTSKGRSRTHQLNLTCVYVRFVLCAVIVLQHPKCTKVLVFITNRLLVYAKCAIIRPPPGERWQANLFIWEDNIERSALTNKCQYEPVARHLLAQDQATVARRKEFSCRKEISPLHHPTSTR